MERDNATSWTEFLLLGFLSQSKAPAAVFTMLFLMFLLGLSENGLLLYLIRVDSGLQSPMYFFLSQLSLMDICQTLAIGPKMTVDFLTKRNVITLIGCSVQMFFIISLAAAEFFLLGVMSYDRYVAICKPLQYPILMRRNIYLSLAVAIWCGASLNALVPAVYVLLQPYCGSNVIRHIFCELPSMLRLSCSDSSVIQRVSFFISTEVLFPTLVTILVSYSCILVTVLRSTGKSHKALGTCLSHLLVVGLFYGAAMFKYLRPMSYRTPFQDDMVSLFCTIVTPMLNPLIYSLRNRDVLDALKKVFRKRTFDQ